MYTTIIVLPDGTELKSGVSTVNAVQSCTITECVNSGTELTLGSVCSSMAEIKLITPAGGLSIAAGANLTIYKDDGFSRHRIGVFTAEKPTRPTAHTMKVTAYDHVSWLDVDVSGMLNSLPSWPYTLYDLAVMVCSFCGLRLVNTEIPNGSYLVQKFTAENITGRQVMQWIGEACGRFCRATAEGEEVEFAWYAYTTESIGTSAGNTSRPIDISFANGVLTINAPGISVTEDAGSLTIQAGNWLVSSEGDTVSIEADEDTRQHFYYQNGLSFEDYVVSRIEKVQIHSNEDDVGVVWPNDTGSTNTYQITGNMLLTDQRVESLQPVAKTLFDQLQNVSYTPCTVTIPYTPDIRAGHIVSITDRNNKTITAYVMTKKQTGQKLTIECTGSLSRTSVTAVNEQSYSALSGKVLNLRTDVEGIKAENRATNGKMASLSLTVDGIDTSVQNQQKEMGNIRNDISTIKQNAANVEIAIQSIRDDGVSKVKTGASYTFDDKGLRSAKTGQQIENLLDNTGMYVKRSGDVLLQANSDGVEATDVHVNNYLIIGENARLENYPGGRTACFYYTGG